MPDADDLVLRPITEDEHAAYHRVESTAFVSLPDEADRQVDLSVVELDRTIGAFVDGALVGTAAAYSFEMTLPGGAAVPVAGVTGVGVLPTHRRRGLLRAMMRYQLDDVAARGEPFAALNASEGSIYRRFGYGVASQYQGVELARTGAAMEVEPASCELSMVPQEEAAAVVAPIYDVFRRRRPGAVARPPAWWDAILGKVKGWKGGGDLFVVVARGDGPDTSGYVIYEIEGGGPGAANRLVIRELVAASDDVDAALWRFCTEVDLVVEVVAPDRPLDDPLRWRLADPRQLRVVRQSDYLWIRLLDIEAAFTDRGYLDDGTLVVAVVDALRPDCAGTYRIEASGGAGRCRRVDEQPDLGLDVAELGSIYLGGVRAVELVRAGRVRERRAGAAANADRLLRSERQPHCTTRF